MSAKMKRRGDKEGSIHKRKDGRWMAQIQVEPSEDGKRIIKSFYGKSRKNVVEKLLQFQLSQAQEYSQITKITVKKHITNWLINYKKITSKKTHMID